MKTPRRAKYRVEFDIPEDASREEVEECLVSHLLSMGGDRRPPGGYGDNDPGDPMFGLDRQTLFVSKLRR